MPFSLGKQQTRKTWHLAYAILEKLTAHSNPAPDNSKTIKELYHELCMQLIPKYGISVLTIAAMRNMSGQLSWVPDWSSDFF